MSADLIQRLRVHATYTSCDPANAHEAADTLAALTRERNNLRTMLAEARSTIDTLPGYPKGADLCDRIDALLTGAAPTSAPTATALRNLIDTLERGDSLKLAEVIERGLEALEGVPAGDADALDARRWRKASTSRNFGIVTWGEFGMRMCWDNVATERIDAALAADAGRANTGEQQ